MISPDGRWLAYQSDESGSDEVYVRRFPGPGGKWLVSAGGGHGPIWSSKKQELFYVGSEGIMVANYTANGDMFVAVKPRLWTKVKDLASGLQSGAGRQALRGGAGRSVRPGEWSAGHLFDELLRRAAAPGSCGREINLVATLSASDFGDYERLAINPHVIH